MILAKEIYKLVRNYLVAGGIDAYSDKIPDVMVYPFIMWEVLDGEQAPDTAFGVDLETITVRFNFFGNLINPSDVMALMNGIEELFNTTTDLELVDTTGGKHLICNQKVGETLRYLEENYYWQGIQDYTFKVQRDL